MLSPVAHGDVSFPRVLNGSDEFLVKCIYILGGCIVWYGLVVECFKELFYFYIESCPICLFVICICASVSCWFESRLRIYYIIMGRWSELKDPTTCQDVVWARLGEQRVMSGDVTLFPAW